MAHGSGGKESLNLIKNVFFKNFNNKILLQQNDSGIIQYENMNIAITTDSFVVTPIFFPGGDIGKLSICGTVNDIAVSGAKVKYITVGFILEEGLKIESLNKIAESMARTAKEAGVEIIAGDTKVVEKGYGNGLYINTTGIGFFEDKSILDKNNIKVGDKIIINGYIGDHGMAILAERESLGALTELKSDCTPLNDLISDILSVTNNVSVMRDPTRGGVATTLNELIENTRKSICVYEEKLPIREAVNSYCELLGLDPLYIANEGKVICIVDEKDAEKVLKVMKKHPKGSNASIIGEVIEGDNERVYLKTSYGATRLLRIAEGEILPRIC